MNSERRNPTPAGVRQTAPVNKMRKMLEVWGDAQVVVHLDFIDGSAVEGLVKEIDRDEVVMEPVYDDGSFGPLTVVNLNHVMMAYYDETPPNLPDEGDTGGEAVDSASAPASTPAASTSEVGVTEP